MTTTPLRPPVTEPPRRSRFTRRTALLAALAALLVVLAATGAWWLRSQPEPEPAAPPVQVPSEAERRAADEEAATAAYQRYLDLSDQAHQRGSTKGIPLDEVADRPVIDRLDDFLADDGLDKITFRGETTATTKVYSWAEIPTRLVMLDACIDTSKSTMTFPDGSDARVGPDGGEDYNVRVPSRVTVTKFTEHWLVTNVYTRPEQTC
jgi:hypothetical protein